MKTKRSIKLRPEWYIGRSVPRRFWCDTFPDALLLSTLRGYDMCNGKNCKFAKSTENTCHSVLQTCDPYYTCRPIQLVHRRRALQCYSRKWLMHTAYEAKKTSPIYWLFGCALSLGDSHLLPGEGIESRGSFRRLGWIRAVLQAQADTLCGWRHVPFTSPTAPK